MASGCARVPAAVRGMQVRVAVGAAALVAVAASATAGSGRAYASSSRAVADRIPENPLERQERLEHLYNEVEDLKVRPACMHACSGAQ